MLDNTNNNSASSSGAPSSSDPHFPFSDNGVLPANKRKRRPAGTPDPDAEVVSLSPKTLLESDRYVCEICNQGFQREQNLQMHRRRHKVPWKLLKREAGSSGGGGGGGGGAVAMKKKVFVCPEPSCLHHDPCHALGDLVGIKKHFRRKHSNHKQWVCDKCSKGYAVQSDYKAHVKTCGTRGHSCDCGRVFSRVESFIEHQDACRVRQQQQRPSVQEQAQSQARAACSSRTASSTSPSSDHHQQGNLSSITPLQGLPLPKKPSIAQHNKHINNKATTNSTHHNQHNLELQLLPSSTNPQDEPVENHETSLKLSIGGSCSDNNNDASSSSTIEVAKLKEFAGEELKLAMAEKAYAEEARKEAKRQIEMAELEFENAKRIRKQAQAEMGKAEALRKQAIKKMGSTVMEITCQACKQHFHSSTNAEDQTSIVVSYMSSANTDGEAE